MVGAAGDSGDIRRTVTGPDIAGRCESRPNSRSSTSAGPIRGGSALECALPNATPLALGGVFGGPDHVEVLNVRLIHDDMNETLSGKFTIHENGARIDMGK